jgi:hypothetical protein
MNLPYLDVKNWSQVGDRVIMYGETLICVCIMLHGHQWFRWFRRWWRWWGIITGMHMCDSMMVLAHAYQGLVVWSIWCPNFERMSWCICLYCWCPWLHHCYTGLINFKDHGLSAVFSYHKVELMKLVSSAGISPPQNRVWSLTSESGAWIWGKLSKW